MNANYTSFLMKMKHYYTDTRLIYLKIKIDSYLKCSVMELYMVVGTYQKTYL